MVLVDENNDRPTLVNGSSVFIASRQFQFQKTRYFRYIKIQTPLVANVFYKFNDDPRPSELLLIKAGPLQFLKNVNLSRSKWNLRGK